MIVGIYARVSRDGLQNEDSPEDQVAGCRKFAESKGWTVANDLIAIDKGISGRSRHNRPALLQLMERIDEWDVLVVWDTSRTARDMEDFGWVLNQLEEHGREGWVASTGQRLDSLGEQVMGVLSAEERRKIGASSHRGLEGRFDRQLATGGAPYGYRNAPVDPTADRHNWKGSRLEIVPEQAEIVHRIFEMRARGEGIRAIAWALNADGIPSPRNTSWAPSALFAILRNSIYRGERVWNRVQRKKARNGKRRAIRRPEKKWLKQQDESWRVVSDDLWNEAQEASNRRPALYQRNGHLLAGTVPGAGHRVRTKYPLAGFVACGECGGAFFGVHRKDRWRCHWKIERGESVCTSKLIVDRTALEERVFGTLRDRILTPETLRYTVEKALGIVESELAEDRAERDQAADVESIREQLAQIHLEAERLVRLFAQGGLAERAAKADFEKLDGKKADLEAKLALAERMAPEIDQSALQRQIERLALEMRTASSGSPEHAHEAFRALLGDRRMTVHPDPERGFRVEGVFDLDLDVDGGGTPPDDEGGASLVTRGRHHRCPTCDCGGLLDPLGIWAFKSGA
jgi:DNA invertase Pin-like site-specific DNA recombinase